MGGLYVHITHIKKPDLQVYGLTHGQVETSRTEQKQELKEAWCSYMFQIPPFPPREINRSFVLCFFRSLAVYFIDVFLLFVAGKLQLLPRVR